MNRKTVSFIGLVLILCLASSAITYAVTVNFSFSTIIEQGSMVSGYSYIVSVDGSTYYAKNGTSGAIDYSGTNASYIFNSVFSNLPSTGGSISVGIGTFEINAPLVWVGETSIPPSKTLMVIGQGRWATVFKATADINMFEVSNGASVGFEHFYIDMNSKNGNGIVGLDTGSTSDRSFQKSIINDIEIRGVVDGYWGMWLRNIYITNTWDNIYIRSAGGGIYIDCDSVGYGNNHFGNIMVSLFGTNDIGVKLLKNNVSMSLNSWDRLHIDGGDSAGATYNLGLEIDGSNYNSFNYLEIENIQYCVKIGTSQTTHGNVFQSGYMFVKEADACIFNLTSHATNNVIRDITCASYTGLGAILINDSNTESNEPNRYYNLMGYSTGFATVGSYIIRQDTDACLLYGQMLWRKAQNAVYSGSFWINQTGMRTLTITHALCLAPPIWSCQATPVEYDVTGHDWTAVVTEIYDSTTTTIMVRINVTSGSATVNALGKLAFWGDVNG